jgi:mono/diheme cytochrome c family protein
MKGKRRRSLSYAATVAYAPRSRYPKVVGHRVETRTFVAIALSTALISCFAPSAGAQNSSTPDYAAAGRALALTACTGCHVVSPDQPFAPVLTGPPDFRSIANRPNTTAASLRRFLSTLQPVPSPGNMADPLLSRDEREKIIAYIMTLQGRR